MYDPATQKFTLLSTCFPTHHLAFSRDHDRLFFSAGVVGPAVLGWLDVKKFEQTKDEEASQAWTPFIVDTSEDGKRGDYVEPDKPVEPGKDKRIAVNEYAIAVSPTDGAVWGTVIGYPGAIVRTVLGANPIETALSEIYEPPLPGYGPRGGDIDADGVYWVALASGHVGSFDRRKCKVLNGPTATGQHCPEGWTLHQLPGPQMRDVKDAGSAEASYYVWVDWFNTFGLGKNVPIIMGNLNSSIFALVDGKFCGKAIHVTAGHALSLQYHERKEETIAIQTGMARLEIGEHEDQLETLDLNPGDSVHVRPGIRHRITALTDIVMLEASTTELGDVVRLEDRYGRVGTSAP
jgi:mannose-6-phosphate isomerase-like protein (cupin superfamily)